MQSFRAVAESGNFSAAARSLAQSPPLVTRRVQALEENLGVRLFNRTTRRVELTEAGQRYLPECVEILDRLEEVESGIRGLGRQPGGLLRVSMPMDFGRLFLGSALRQFMSQSPEICIEAWYDDRETDLLRERVDVAIRIGRQRDSSLVSRKLGQACIACYASEDYLATHGAPAHPDELAGHQLLDYTLSRQPGLWAFTGGHQVSTANRSRLAGNNGRALAAFACQGLGIVRLPEFLVQDHLANGRIVEVLSAFRSDPLDISAVYQHRQFKPAKITAFVDFLDDHFKRRADWLPSSVWTA